MAAMIIEYAPAAAIFLVAIGLLGYALALVLATFFSKEANSLGGRLAAWFKAAQAQNLGIPCSAISAFAITAVLLKAFVPDPSGPLSLKAFGLEFSGPSGPITLWLMCFLGFVAAIRLLRA
jgi:hypothetical protein